MSGNRRVFLMNTLSAGAICLPAIGRSNGRKISQAELCSAITQHEIWLRNKGSGKRANFESCDLSGLDLSFGRSELVNLRAADFTAANLSGSVGDNVSFWHASMHGADLSCSFLKRPNFIYTSLRGAHCDHVVWGDEERVRRCLTPASTADGAVFQHADVSGNASFKKATIHGDFFDTNFGFANLAEANFSFSNFYGSGPSCLNSFFNANLRQANFVSANISHTRFGRAKLKETDFTDAVFGLNVTPSSIVATIKADKHTNPTRGVHR